jgi:LuxR family transcriptional regulator, maltose regulon positive regulatory protein
LNDKPTQSDQSSIPGLLATRLRPPNVRTSIIHRARLFERIDSSDAKLILIAAPAGFGKSTLVVDWLRSRRARYAWLSIEESDNEPLRFLQYLIAALRTVEPKLGEDVLPVLKGTSPPSSATILTHLLNELAGIARAEPLYLVLDDYYFIENRDIHQSLDLLTDHLPQNMRIIISTRVDPPLPLHRMRVRGELTEIRARDLRFTVDEVAEFFNAMKIQISPDDVRQLAERTEGWIAGLQLAAVSLHDIGDAKQFIESFTGSNRYVLDYLLEEVLNRQPKEVLTFLLQTSILTRFNADLCNAITGGMNARAILEHLERSHLFLIPLDDRREWFRYHHLFSELLQYRLKQLYAGLVTELHSNASVWFEERGDVREAIDYAFRIRDNERAAYLLNQYATYFLSRSELSTLIRYEEKLPRQVSEKCPALTVGKAWAYMLMHRTGDVDAILAAAERLASDPTVSLSEDEIRLINRHISTIGAFLLRLRGDLEQARSATEALLADIQADERMIRGLLRFNLGRIYSKQGFAERARKIMEEAYEDNYSAKNYYVTLAILANTGFLCSITDSLGLARQKLEASLEFIQNEKLGLLPAAGYVYNQLGRVLYNQNELDDALEHLGRAAELGKDGDEPDIVCNALFASAWIHAIRGEAERALAAFSEADEIERRSPIAIYESDVAVERATIAFILNDMDRVEEWMQGADVADNGGYSVISEHSHMLRIMYLVHIGRFDDALERIARLRGLAQERERRHVLLQLDVLAGVAEWELGKREHAAELMGKGLQTASSMGYTRALLNIGNRLASVLAEMLRCKKLKESDAVFAGSLLQGLSGDSPEGIQIIPKFRQGIAESLTEREQEVLYYISQDYSNKEIAEKIFVSLDTVKTHLKNLYGKLGVHSRRDAVSRATELHLLG